MDTLGSARTVWSTHEIKQLVTSPRRPHVGLKQARVAHDLSTARTKIIARLRSGHDTHTGDVNDQDAINPSGDGAPV